MRIEIHDDDQYALLRLLDSELTEETFNDLQSLISEKMEAGNFNFILDMELVEEPKPETFASFEVINHLIEKEGGILIIASPHADLRDALEERTISSTPTLPEAVDYMFMETLQRQLEEGEDL